VGDAVAQEGARLADGRRNFGDTVTCGGQATLTTERPWGVLVTADGVIGPAEGEADVDLTDMLDLAQQMGLRPGL